MRIYSPSFPPIDTRRDRLRTSHTDTRNSGQKSRNSGLLVVFKIAQLCRDFVRAWYNAQPRGKGAENCVHTTMVLKVLSLVTSHICKYGAETIYRRSDDE